jgi:tetratricopeptide (TPR) repeat protein
MFARTGAPRAAQEEECFMASIRAAMSLRRGWSLALAALILAAPAPRSAAARTVEEWIAAGDGLYSQALLDQAHAEYLAGLKEAPGHFVLLCRLARTESEFAELQKGDVQRTTRAAAVEHARAAIKAAPDSAGGHVWLAVALGRQALSEGPKTKLALSKEIKSEVDRAMQLDPSIGRAWHVLAMWNVKIASLNTFERMAANAVLGGVPKGASMENADKAFQKAIELEPNYLNHHLEYARMLKDTGRREQAKQELRKVLALPPTSGALDRRYQAEATELLAKLK